VTLEIDYVQKKSKEKAENKIQPHLL